MAPAVGAKMAVLAYLLVAPAFAATLTRVAREEPAEEPTEEKPGPSPLQKVTTLLTEMKAQVEKEAEEDQLAYDKYACWCETTEKQKTAAIEEAAAGIEELTAFIGEAAAKEGQLKTEIDTLASDIQEDTDALAEATALREKEKAAFEAEEAEMTETIEALKKAIEVLSSVQLTQTAASPSPTIVAQATDAANALMQIKHVVRRRFPQFEEVMKRDLYDVLGDLQNAGDAFLPRRSKSAFAQQAPMNGAAAGAQSYNSRSGQIFGVLQEMYDEFGRDLKEATEEEAKALATFSDLKEAKEGEIAAATSQKKAKESEVAQLIKKNADAKEDKASLEDAQAKDQTFVANLKEGCTKEDEEYKARVTIRTQEIAALGEALTILTDDDARELFGKTMASFLQENSASSASMERRKDRAAESAMKRLVAVARRHKNWSLAALAVRARLDAFTKVKAAMDKMTAELEAQMKEEEEKAETCKKDLDKTEDEIKVAKIEESDLAMKHQQITNALVELADAMEKLKSDVAATEVSLKQAGEARKAENKVFQTTLSDQRATIEILKKVLARLESFYTTKGAVLAQVRAHHRQEPGAPAPAPPPTPKDYTKNANAGGVLQVLAMIIQDAESEEIEIEKAEQQAQTTYATFASDCTASIEADRAAIAEKEKQTAEAEAAKSETEEAQLANGEALAKLEDLLGAHHLDCDWLLKYYDVRQQALAEELGAIADAKAILSGASFS